MIYLTIHRKLVIQKVVHRVSTQTSFTFKIESILYHQLNDEDMHYLTGFYMRNFSLLFEAHHEEMVPCYFQNLLSNQDQLILCLIKYRLNLHYILIGKLYGISRIRVSEIFEHWTKLIYKYLKSIDFWSLKLNRKDTYTAIIDCSEIKTEKNSKDPQANQEMFLHDKNDYTIKYLVGIDEAGAVIYFSDAFGGCTSDKQVVLESEFLDILEEGDTILADRGFDISDLLETNKVALNIPPFLRNKQQLCEIEVFETRIIANRRIHVERVIRLTKKNKIMSEKFPHHLWHLANEIVYNNNFLCIFKKSVVGSKN